MSYVGFSFGCETLLERLARHADPKEESLFSIFRCLLETSRHQRVGRIRESAHGRHDPLGRRHFFDKQVHDCLHHSHVSTLQNKQTISFCWSFVKMDSIV